MKRVHFHKYERFRWPNGSYYYKCMQPGCTHYLPVLEMVIGRESVCWGCNSRVIIITKDDVSTNGGIKHPMCEKCREERKERKAALAEID